LRSICCSRPNVLDLLIEELNEVVCIDVGVDVRTTPSKKLVDGLLHLSWLVALIGYERRPKRSGGSRKNIWGAWPLNI